MTTENTIQTTGNQPVELSEQETTREPERYVTPPVDIYEDDHGLTVLADLPGFAQDQIDVNVDNNILTIKAVAPEQEGAQDAAFREFRPVSYFRQFRLGEKIDRTKISAKAQHGTLTLKLPYAEETKPRRIQVDVA